MTKKEQELRQAKAEAIKNMRAIVDKADEEKRAKTAEEQAEFEQGLQRRMKALDSVFPGIYEQQARHYGWKD